MLIALLQFVWDFLSAAYDRDGKITWRIILFFLIVIGALCAYDYARLNH